MTQKYLHRNRCTIHGRVKAHTHNVVVEGVAVGVYQCPIERCQGAVDYGVPYVGYAGITPLIVKEAI